MQTSDSADDHAQFSILSSSCYIRLVRWAFARLYNELAWGYNGVAIAVSGGRWFDWVRATLPYLGGQVLELGCGTGALQLAQRRTRVAPAAIGLDASPAMISHTRRRLTRAGFSIVLARAVAQALPFAPASVDTVVATFPSEYIIDPATLREIRRVLRPGGRLVVVLAAAFAGAGPYQRALDLLYRITLQRSPLAPADPAPRSLLGLRLAAQGFAVEERWEPVGDHAVHLVIGQRI